MSKNEGSHDPGNLEPTTIQFRKSLKITKFDVFFFEHGKDAHRDFEKGALNESSRSLIWSFLEQIVFSGNCEKVSKIKKWINFGYIPDGPKQL